MHTASPSLYTASLSAKKRHAFSDPRLYMCQMWKAGYDNLRWYFWLYNDKQILMYANREPV